MKQIKKMRSDWVSGVALSVASQADAMKNMMEEGIDVAEYCK